MNFGCALVAIVAASSLLFAIVSGLLNGYYVTVLIVLLIGCVLGMLISQRHVAQPESTEHDD